MYMRPLCELQKGVLSFDGPLHCGRSYPLGSSVLAFPELLAWWRPSGMWQTYSFWVSWPQRIEGVHLSMLDSRESSGHLSVLERSLTWRSGQTYWVLIPRSSPSLWELS